MDQSVIQAALLGLEQMFERAREAKAQVEAEANGRRTEGPVYLDAERALSSILSELYETLLVILEAGGLSDTRLRLIDRWPALRVDETEYDPEFDYADNAAYRFLASQLDGLRNAVSEVRPGATSYDLIQLEALLRRTAVLVKRRGVIPSRELDIQDVMHDYLGAFFIEYRPTVSIPGIITDFKPDCGVRNLNAAIEFKFAQSDSEVRRAMRGILEDISGYAGSRDWNRFYTVIYQTAAYESEDRVRSELTRAGALTWKAILVTGAGEPRPGKAVASSSGETTGAP